MRSITIASVLLDWTWKDDDTNFYRIRITGDRQVKYIKTNILVHRDQVGRDGRVKDIALRRRIEDYVRDIEDTVASIHPDALARMTMDQVMDYIRGFSGDEFRLDFFAFGREAVADKTPSSRKAYESALASLQEFVGRGTMDISEMTSSFLREYESWLTRKYGEGARAVSSYTAALRYIHGRARARYNNEELEQMPIRNPFQYYHPPQQRQAAHRSVDADIIRRMIEVRQGLSGRERLGVDVFLISFALMGMNAPDLYSCAPAVDGVITYNRTKTAGRRADRALMKVRVEPPVESLLKEYAPELRRNAFDFNARYTSYQIFGQNVNAGLRSFCKRQGYDAVTLYGARHSWASTAYRCNVDRYVINDCLCHVDKSMKVTDVYIDKDWRVMWDANAKVLAQFQWV